jgi:hypothetical protein
MYVVEIESTYKLAIIYEGNTVRKCIINGETAPCILNLDTSWSCGPLDDRRFISWLRFFSSLYIGCWVGPTTSLEVVEMRKKFPNCRESGLDSSVFHPVAYIIKR